MKVNDSMKKNKVIVVLVFAFICVFSIVGVLFASGMFDVKGRKFITLLTKEQYVVKIIEACKEEYYNDIESNYSLTLKKSPLSEVQNFFVLGKNNLIKSDIELNANIIKNEKNIDSKFSLKPISNEIKNVDIIKEDGKLAISILSLFDEFIVIDGKNGEKDIKKLFNISGDENKDSLNQTKKILEKYSGILASAINRNVTVNDKVSISIDGNLYETKQYVLTLDKNAFNNICVDIFEEVINDEKTITFITNKFNEFNTFNKEFLDENYSLKELKNDDIKEKIADFYDYLNNIIKKLNNADEVLKIVIYEYEDYNIKTEIEIMNKKYNMISEAIKKDEMDYINIVMKILGDELKLKYTGEKKEYSYFGKINIISGNNPLLSKISIERVKDSEAKVRKFENLNTIILSKANDDEIKDLREQIKKNLKTKNVENENTGIGDFKLPEPKTDEDIVQNSRLAYNRINPIMTKDEAIKIMGEPSKFESGDDGVSEYLYWNQKEGIELISVKTKGIKLYNVYNNVALGNNYNNQLIKELGEGIEDLNSLSSSINVGFSKDEVISVLGDKYIEVSKSNLGYIAYKWYDKNGNSVVVEFDENGMVLQIE